jgi:tetratricopeptide (TPR) repeat protein
MNSDSTYKGSFFRLREKNSAQAPPPSRRQNTSMYFRLILIALCVVPAARGTDFDELMHRALVAETGQHSQAALELYQRLDKISPDNPVVLQKIARQYSDLVAEQPDNAGKKRYAEMALAFSQRAVALEPKNAVNVLSVAVCHGKLALYSDTSDKIKYSRLVWEEARRALSLDPNYAWAHHVLGRWNCEVATLGATSKVVVKLFYGDLPPASVDEGVRQLQRAAELEPDELSHWFELGFAYLAAGKPVQARLQWIHGLHMPSRGVYDESAKQKAREALARLG